jgi:hypothetical protein
MDTVLSQSMIQFCNCFATYISILIVISVATQWFAIAILPITIVYVVVQVGGGGGGGWVCRRRLVAAELGSAHGPLHPPHPTPTHPPSATTSPRRASCSASSL